MDNGVDVRVVRPMHGDVLLSVCTLVFTFCDFFFSNLLNCHRNKHIMIDLGTGNNNKM